MWMLAVVEDPRTARVPANKPFRQFAALQACMHDDERGHIVPHVDDEVRAGVVETLAAAGVPFHDGGVYCQTRGPRFETPAEVKFLGSDAVGGCVSPDRNAVLVPLNDVVCVKVDLTLPGCLTLCLAFRPFGNVDALFVSATDLPPIRAFAPSK